MSTYYFSYLVLHCEALFLSSSGCPSLFILIISCILLYVLQFDGLKSLTGLQNEMHFVLAVHLGPRSARELSGGGGHLFSHLLNICIALCMVDGLLHGELRGCLVCCGFHCSYPKIGEIFHTKYVGYIEAYPDTHSSSLSIQCSVFCVSFYSISTFCFQ